MKNNSTQRADGQQPTVNNYGLRLNDEPDSPDSYRDREAPANDELAAANFGQPETGNGQNTGVNDDLAHFSGTTISIRTRPNKNDPDTSGSFVFMCIVNLWEIFSAVGLFQNRGLVLLSNPVRVKENKESISR